MNISFQTVGLVFVGIVEIILGILIYTKERKNDNNILFTCYALTVSWWVLSVATFEFIPMSYPVSLYGNMPYLAATFIPVFFVLFTYNFPSNKLFVSKKKAFLILMPSVIIVFLLQIPEYILRDFSESASGYKIIFFGSGYVFYSLYIVAYFLWSYVNLASKYLKSEGVLKIQVGYIFLGTVIATIVGVTTNLILPFWGDFRFFGFGPIATIIIVVLTFYAILKHHLFNIKVVATEIFSVAIVFLAALELSLSKSKQELIVKAILFLMVTVFAYLLVRGVLKEVRTREEMEELAKNLAVANDKLRVLDQAKSDFVTIASHQLRTPVTAIKGYSSMLAEGSYGKLSAKVKETVDKIFYSSNRLVFMIGDFLNLSRIERGKMQYTFAPADLKEIIEILVDEFKEVVKEQKQKVKITFRPELSCDKATKGKEIGDFMANVDADKIRQVVSNLIDNSVKYGNKEGSEIEVFLKKTHTCCGPKMYQLSPIADKEVEVAQQVHEEKTCDCVSIEIKDNGIGMDKETLGKIFDKFVRADATSSQYSSGSGLGLYVGKVIVEAHGGRIWAESEGEGKGSSFFIELPKNFEPKKEEKE